MAMGTKLPTIGACQSPSHLGRRRRWGLDRARETPASVIDAWRCRRAAAPFPFLNSTKPA